MQLNVWQRAGAVASVLWIAGAATFELMHPRAVLGPNGWTVTSPTDLPRLIALALLPVVAGWAFGLAVRWVLAGRRPTA